MANNLIDKTQEQLLKYTLKYYKIAHKEECNIEHPTLFTEKIQWYTFFYNNPLCPYIVDKVTFKDYIREKLGEGFTIPLLGAWKSVSEFEKSWHTPESEGGLPKEFCLKSNLQCNGRCIKIIHDKDSVNFDEIRKEVEQWLRPENTCINSLARNFYSSTPQILAEEYMSNFEDQLFDYKVFCFSGEPYCIYVAIDRFDSDMKSFPVMFYDAEWSKMDVILGQHPNNVNIERPVHFEQMMQIAKQLSKDFPFVRVDFFDNDDNLMVAELTFNPSGGFTPFYPKEFNKKLGDLFILPEEKK